jgi:hypothetical protein
MDKKQVITMEMENGAICYHCAGLAGVGTRIAKGEQCIVIPSMSTGTYYIALAHKDLWPESLDVVVPV